MRRFFLLGCIGIAASACSLEASSIDERDAGGSTIGSGVTTGPSSVTSGTGPIATSSGATTGTSTASSTGAGGTLTTGSSTAAGGGTPGTFDGGHDPSLAGSGGSAGQGGARRDGGMGGSGGGAGGAKVDASTTVVDAAADYNTPLVCTSGDRWLNGDRGAAAMHPGRACIDCHTMKNGPAFSIAGTIFPTAHEPDDCNGTDGLFAGATIRITGADGQVFTVQANFAGNFNLGTNSKVALPFRAKVVVADGRERAMQTPQMIGDCNGCHTVTGANGAPGRIIAP